MDDSRVIPYNPYLLLKYGCHINVEYVFGQKACKYIFKYLLKGFFKLCDGMLINVFAFIGFEKAYVQVHQKSRRGGNNQNEEIYDYDEMAATFKVRYLTAMEAYLRLHSYRIVQMSHQIYTLSVHEERGQTIVFEEGHEEEGQKKLKQDTRLTAFFKLCRGDPEARKLTYDKLPFKYRLVFYIILFMCLMNNFIFVLVGIIKHTPGSSANIHCRTIRQKQKCLLGFTP